MKQRKLWVEHDKKKYLFVLGEVVESLQGAGVETGTAINIARAIEKHSRGHGKTLSLAKLISRIAAMLEDEVSKDVAERFRVQTPPFVPLSVQLGDEVVPFSQRKLATSFEKLGLKLKEAYALAAQIEQNFRSKGYELIHELELLHIAALSLEASHGRDLRLRYETQLGQPLDVQVLEHSGRAMPFSRGILAQSLMAVGLDTEVAHAFARQLEDVLWKKGLSRITRDDLRQEVRSLLHAEAGERFAQRYSRMRALRQTDQPLIILIGGAPGVGKSSLAYELAYRLGIRRIVSVDAVRQALRSLISKQLSPALHASSFDAWRTELIPGEKGGTPKRKQVIRSFQGQVLQLGNALTGIIQRGIEESTSMVLEGVHIVPGILPLAQLEGATFVELVLTLEDPEVHKRHFAMRDQQTKQRRQQSRYQEHFVEIRMLHDFVKEQARREGVATVTFNDLEQAMDQALELVLSAAMSDDKVALPTSEKKRM